MQPDETQGWSEFDGAEQPPSDDVSRETVAEDASADAPEEQSADVTEDESAEAAEDESAGASNDESPGAPQGESAQVTPRDHAHPHDTPIAREAMQAVHVLNIRQEQWPQPPTTRIITVANQKGGVGKTTSAVNVAVAMALHGLRVMVIDLDPQGNASTALGVAHHVGVPSSYDVILNNQPISEVAVQVDAADSLLCVPATIDLAGADIELTSQVAREHRLRRALVSYLKDKPDIDYIFIDCPPSLGLLTLNGLVAAREVLIPIQCEYYALEGLAQLLSTVEMVQSYLNRTLAVTTVLLTMYDSRTKLADQVADEVRAYFKELVVEPVIPRNVRVSEAPGFGQTVITYDAGSRGAVGYLQAARDIAERGITEAHLHDGHEHDDGEAEEDLVVEAASTPAAEVAVSEFAESGGAQ